ncbi:DUF397 domain-containing protein [Salinispora arenicola]|uniref:DUF397 domain-containing protein n=1 Tax=Salinispora arenicola TaxID=168697 RepID=UPI0009B8882D|nr:DUF397 domain-containing protein [Salinispora arenicola]MCN0153836.1 DUF397 domain-containing protein [Salinispora arenicola]
MTTPDSAVPAWRKSSRSSANGSDCVEVAGLGEGLAVRDSKDPCGPVLVFGSAAWTSFVAGLRTAPRR